MSMHTPTPSSQKDNSDAMAFLRSVDDAVDKFEVEESERLDIDSAKKDHWYDANPTQFMASQRAHTTILHAGLTMAHDLFIQSSFRGLGYKVEAMDVPDTKALQFGREFGNRGQCNPTYFTVGNLVKKLKELEATGISKKDIITKYIFATAGSCGPCRFGTYVTEYRKALRDAGFEGFRVILFQQSGGVKQATGEKLGLDINAQFFLTITKAVWVGDILNAMMYRTRPYEVEAGATDAAVERAKIRISKAFETRKGFYKALLQTRKDFKNLKVDRTRIKPRVAIIGEFWAMTTEGDGNYKMQRFLEGEGAEVEVQTVTSWTLYLMWAAKYDTLERAKLKGVDKGLDGGVEGSKFALEGVNVAKKIWGLRAVDAYTRINFKILSKFMGLGRYHLPDMNHIAEISHAFYDNNLRGGEGHMEVGKLIHNVVDQTVNMTLSIKPFGCMPSSAVSDGVQSIITELYPQAIFLPIETNGDGAVNVYSRVQMQLFKAKKAAEGQVQAKLDQNGLNQSDFASLVKNHPKMHSAIYRAKHAGANSALDNLQAVIVAKNARWYSPLIKAAKLFWFDGAAKKQKTLNAVKKVAEQKESEAQKPPADVVRIVEV